MTDDPAWSRQRRLLRELYFRATPRAIRFQAALLIFDVLLIAFFAVSPFIEHGGQFLAVDYAIAGLLVLDLAARSWGYGDFRRWVARPIVWADIAVLVSLLLAPVVNVNLGFLRILRGYSMVNGSTFWRLVGGGRWQDSDTADTVKAAINPIGKSSHILPLSALARDSFQCRIGGIMDGLGSGQPGRSGAFYIEGETLRESDPTTSAEIQVVSPGFFETLRTPLVAGRFLDWDDVYGQRQVVMISENLAHLKWGSAEAAVGKRASGSSSGPWCEIVGVIKDVRHLGLDEPAPSVVAYPLRALWMATNPSQRTASFVVRSERVATPGLLEDLQNAAWSVNGNLSPGSVRTLDQMYRGSIARTSVTLFLLVATGAMALILGVVGIYGVVSYSVSQRRREIGIRLALGARMSIVRWMFVRQILVLAAVGIVIGLGAAAGLTQLIASQLFGVTPLDVPTYLSVAIVLAAAAVLAAYLSSLRASEVNPVEALKAE